MKHTNFYLKLISILLIITAIFFYNRMAENRIQESTLAEMEARTEALEAQVAQLTEQQEELLGAFETLSKELKLAMDKKQEIEEEEETEQEDSSKEETEEEYVYEEGTFTGEGEGFGGKIQVEIEISKDTLTDIRITDAPGEDAAYLNLAKGVIDQVLEKQSTDVDTISGATFSSTGILIAIEEALGKAEKES